MRALAHDHLDDPTSNEPNRAASKQRNLTPAQAVLIPVDFAQDMGLTNTLTPSRSNGFRNMYDKVMNEIRASVE